MSLGWIDFSSEHRERTRSAIAALSAPGAIDDLGIGIIRDAFADKMFPGISTVQTRPKYFLLTLSLLEKYRRLDHTRKQKSFEAFLEEEELEDRVSLVMNHSSDLATGIIGSKFETNRKKNVLRRPSSVYWNGLRAFGMVMPRNLSLVEFGARVSGSPRSLNGLLQGKGDEKGDDFDALDHTHSLRADIPPGHGISREELSISLSGEEASFLRDKIVENQAQSLIGQILSINGAIEQVANLPKEKRQLEALAELPFAEELTDEMRMTVQHALKFWLLMKGAHIRYNCLLQDKFGSEDFGKQCNDEWESWREKLPQHLEGWNSETVWDLLAEQGRRTRPATKEFVESWFAVCRSGCAEVARCDYLVTRQEIANKKSRARLKKQTAAIDEWIGFKTLDYRFPQVFALVKDIHEGLGGRHA